MSYLKLNFVAKLKSVVRGRKPEAEATVVLRVGMEDYLDMLARQPSHDLVDFLEHLYRLEDPR